MEEEEDVTVGQNVLEEQKTLDQMQHENPRASALIPSIQPVCWSLNTSEVVKTVAYPGIFLWWGS